MLRERGLSKGLEVDVGLAEYVDMLTAFALRVDRRRTTGEDGRFSGESWLGGLWIGSLVLDASSLSRSSDRDLLWVR